MNKASLEFDNNMFYSLAIAQFDKKNIARSRVDNIINMHFIVDRLL